MGWVRRGHSFAPCFACEAELLPCASTARSGLRAPEGQLLPPARPSAPGTVPGSSTGSDCEAVFGHGVFLHCCPGDG